MVNLTNILLRRHPFNVKCDPYWRKRQILRLAATMYGRSRTCFSLAIRKVQKSLQHVTQGRDIQKRDYHNLWVDRITAGCQEVGYMPQGTRTLMEGLAQSQILLNHQVLANLAVWEPRTFMSLNKIAAVKAHDPKAGMKEMDQLGPLPKGVTYRGEDI